MSAQITFFPVGNGGMSLIRLNDAEKTTILVDVKITAAMDDVEDDAPDNAAELRKRLQKDNEGRPYVDVFLLSHPDQDHCAGLENHFHLGRPDDYDHEPPEGEALKIFIREMWSSPTVFRRASKGTPLCEDAKAWKREAKRRVRVFQEGDGAIGEGDRILIIGRDENGKTDDLNDILVEVNEVFSKVNGSENDHVSVRVLGPLPRQEDEDDEEMLQKNRSSVILQFSIAFDGKTPGSCLFLTGGDADVGIWEKLWKLHRSTKAWLEYDLLQTPHHCSWRSLSYDSWSENDDPQVNEDAKSALGQALSGAFIVSSSVPITDDTGDPPCTGAKAEYISILDGDAERFYCTGEEPDEESPEPLEFMITAEGPQPPGRKAKARHAVAGIAVTREPFEHG